MSTMESEYIALSLAMRDLIPLRERVQEICNQIGMKNPKTTRVCKTMVHEDNTGCLKLVTMEPGRMTPRSKRYGVKYHWFRSKLKINKIKIKHVKSQAQKANFLTKALQITPFQENRKLTCGRTNTRRFD